MYWFNHNFDFFELLLSKKIIVHCLDFSKLQDEYLDMFQKKSYPNDSF